MAKKATAKTSGKSRGSSKSTKARPKSRALVERRVGERGRRSADAGTGDAFIKLLQSPLVAELVAVAATAALAALAEQGFTSSSASRRSRAGNAVKAAGKAAAAAIGRRLSTEIEEIRKASNASKGSAKA
jgi:hypothetical protein